MNQAELLARVRTRLYNCAHFAADVWAYETGEDIRDLLTGFLDIRHNRTMDPGMRRTFARLPEPVSPCLVMFRRPKAEPHVGVYVRGKVLHLDEKAPVRQLVADIVTANGFKTVDYYAPR